MPTKTTPRPTKPAKRPTTSASKTHQFVTTPVPKPAPFVQTNTQPRRLGTSMR